MSTESKTQITFSPRQTNAEFESFDDDYRVRCEPNVAKHVCKQFTPAFSVPCIRNIFEHLSTFTCETGILFGY